MTAKRAVGLLLVALAVYFAIIGYHGVYLLEQHRITLRVLGVAVLVLPLVGIWVVVAELRFGLATERLGRQLGPDSVDDLPRTPAGRIDRVAADERFELRRAAVEADPDAWQGWYRLAIAYDDAGDRKRARAAMRTAIERSAERVS
jgi:hypothetical protein